jgi:hypothetical protein
MSYSQSLREIRDTHYSHQRKDNWDIFKIDIDDFKSSPYTFLKWRFYLETSSLLLYVLVRTNIKPNHITFVYAFLGILTLLFLSLSNQNKIFLYLGLFIAFSKTILDACDGYIARLKDQKSISGFILDPYGAYINTIGFQSGIGFYLANTYDKNYFLYLVFLIPFCYAIRLKNYAYSNLLNEIIENKDQFSIKHSLKNKKSNTKNSKLAKLEKSNLRKLYNLFLNILDDRARSVDFIILLFLIETIFDLRLIEYVFYFLIFKHLIIVLISLFVYSNNEWLESKINKL